VSSDIVRDSRASVVDLHMTRVVDGSLAKAPWRLACLGHDESVERARESVMCATASRASVTTQCRICGREFDSDPIYSSIEASPHPPSVARQVVAYHSARLRFEVRGCEAVGLRHLRPSQA